MPDETGKLSETERREIAAKIEAHWKEPRVCPICHSATWTLAEYIVQPMTVAGNGISLGGPGYPQVMLISRPCGYTFYFNAILLGAIRPDDGPEKSGLAKSPDGDGGDNG